MTTTPTGPADAQGIDLADAIEAIRSQLVEAASRGSGSDLAFEVGPIELEFNVELKLDAHGRAGVRAWVFSGEASGGVERGRSQRVAVTLTPKRRSDGGHWDVGHPDAARNTDGF